MTLYHCQDRLYSDFSFVMFGSQTSHKKCHYHFVRKPSHLEGPWRMRRNLARGRGQGHRDTRYASTKAILGVDPPGLTVPADGMWIRDANQTHPTFLSHKIKNKIKQLF